MSKFITSLEDLAFEEIIRSVYESFNVECRGILFGKIKQTKADTKYYVESAHAIQLAKRYYNKVHPSNGSWRGDWRILNNIIGSYHSHPEHITITEYVNIGGEIIERGLGRVNTSEPDRKNLKEDRGKIEIITS